MPAKILQGIFSRVEMTKCEAAVLQAILSKANIYGKRAKVSILCLMAITGYKRSSVYAAIASLEQERRLLRVTRRYLWHEHSAINVYEVVIPWRRDPCYDERAVMRWGKKDNRGPQRLDPNIHHADNSPKPPAHPCSEWGATRSLPPSGAPPPPPLGFSRAKAAARLGLLGCDPQSDHYTACLQAMQER